MRKGFLILCLCTPIFLMSGCKNHDSKLNEQVTMNEYLLPIPEKSEVSAFYYKDGMIYYVVDHTAYYDEQMTLSEGTFEFTDDLNTEIHAYNPQTLKDELIYHYSASRPIGVSEIFSGEGKIYWEEYGPNGFILWATQALENGGYSSPEVLLSSEDTNENVWMIRPKYYRDVIYWYEPQGDRYDLRGYENGHIYTYHDDVYLASPYEPPLMSKGFYSYAVKSEEGKINVIYRPEEQEEETINCSFADIGSVFSGERYLAWKDGYYNEYLIQLYDLKKKAYETLDLDYYFSIGLIDDILFVDTDKEMLVYQLPGLEVIGSREGKYLYIQQNDVGDLYCENAVTGGILVMESRTGHAKSITP